VNCEALRQRYRKVTEERLREERVEKFSKNAPRPEKKRKFQQRLSLSSEIADIKQEVASNDNNTVIAGV
jgi:hypothetical protein